MGWLQLEGKNTNFTSIDSKRFVNVPFRAHLLCPNFRSFKAYFNNQSMQRITLLFLLFVGLIGQAQVQSPEEFLGYPVGTQFSRHADVVAYFNHVADQSPMVQYDTYGKTYERRPLTYAVVSTPENLAKIDQIRTDNLKSIGLASGSADQKLPLFG